MEVEQLLFLFDFPNRMLKKYEYMFYLLRQSNKMKFLKLDNTNK